MKRSSARHSPGWFGKSYARQDGRCPKPAGAAPLTRRWQFKPQMELLENRCVPTVSLISNFAGLTNASQGAASGFTVEPPDTITATGPKNVVEMVNFAVAFYDKAGNLTGPGASPNQNGMLGDAPWASSTRTTPRSTRRMR